MTTNARHTSQRTAWASCSLVGAVLFLAVVVPGCGAESSRANIPVVPVDSSLVDLLADLHLADARVQAFEGAGPSETATDSAQAAVLALHGMTQSEFSESIQKLAREPEVAAATYLALETDLGLERQGATR